MSASDLLQLLLAHPSGEQHASHGDFLVNAQSRALRARAGVASIGLMWRESMRTLVLAGLMAAAAPVAMAQNVCSMSRPAA
jgi:hypothetical protein